MAEAAEEEELKLSLVLRDNGIPELKLDGHEESVDEEKVLMSSNEINAYVMQKIKEYIADEGNNPVLRQIKKCQRIQVLCKEMENRIQTIRKSHLMMMEKQVKFLRKVGILPKIPTSDKSCGANFPTLSFARHPHNIAATIPPTAEMPVLNASVPKGPSPAMSNNSVQNAKTNDQSASTENLSPPKLLRQEEIEFIDLTD